jgi:HAD superfamily hydrolase (TIGR01509 family)
MRAILFDFGGTLDFPQHWLDRFVTHYRAAGIDIDRPQLDPAFSVATCKAYNAGRALYEFGLSALVEFLITLQLDSLRQTVVTPHKLYDFARSRSSVSELTRRIRDGFVAESAEGLAQSRRVLESLSSRFKLAVVSNFYGNLARVISDAGFASFIQVVTDSGRVGFYKPDTRIFAAALADLGVSASEAMMVGDSIGKDCVPAQAMGLTTVWLRHREFQTRDVPGNVDFTIDRLEELNNLKWLND